MWIFMKYGVIHIEVAEKPENADDIFVLYRIEDCLRGPSGLDYLRPSEAAEML